MLCVALAAFSSLIWLYLLSGRGRYWAERLQPWPTKETYTTPDVVVVVPARDEEAVIAKSIRSLIRQDYTGPFKIVLVDDHSTDKTAALAREVSENLYQMARLHIIQAPPLPEGWSGKLWAMQAGLSEAKKLLPKAEYVLFTDADIEHNTGSLRELVVRAESGKLALASFMVKLNCASWAEKFLVPAFVYFFAMLYPFSKVRHARSNVAAAAGGAMLARCSALEAAGGLSVLKDALIDDCTLAKHLKKQGPIWLGLSANTFSLREYMDIKPIWDMIARTAYAQLFYSPFLLLVCVVGMVLTFLVPVFAALFCGGQGAGLGFITWALMALSYIPMLRFYGLPPLYGLALPFIAFFYLLATLDSAFRYYTGRGGEWKGRIQAKKKP